MRSEQLGSTRSICTRNAGRSSHNELDSIVPRTQDGKYSEKMTSTDSQIKLDADDRTSEAKSEAFSLALILGGEAKQVRDSRPADECLNSLSVGPAIQKLLRESDLPVHGVTSTLRMEESSYTSEYHAMVHDKDDSDVIGVVGIVKASREETKPRAPSSSTTDGFQGSTNTKEYHVGGKLLRFVFEQEGRPLNDANDSAKVLEAVTQWIDALLALDKVGVFHRGVSFGNLLPKLDSSAEGGWATSIDVGLAHPKPRYEGNKLSDKPQEALECPATTKEGKTADRNRSNQSHHQVTGTLPFIAYELVNQLHEAHRGKERIQHAIQHDVESIFWVVVYLCMKFGGDVQPWVKTDVEYLCSAKVDLVTYLKSFLLQNEGHLLDVGGPFASLGAFLEDFTGYYQQCRLNFRRPIEASEVRALAVKHRDILKQAPENAEADAPVILPSEQPRAPPKSLGNLGGSSSKRAYSVKESERRMSNVEEEVRLQNEDEGPEPPSKKRRMNEAGPLEFSTSNQNLA